MGWKQQSLYYLLVYLHLCWTQFITLKKYIQNFVNSIKELKARSKARQNIIHKISDIFFFHCSNTPKQKDAWPKGGYRF